MASVLRSFMRPNTAPAAQGCSDTTYKTNIDEESNFKVCVRIRPESEREKVGNHNVVVKALDEHVLAFDPKADDMPDFNAAAGAVRKNPRVLEKRARDIKFAFDRVFDQESSQKDIFEYTAKYATHTMLPDD